MDTQYEYAGQQFCWDLAKASANYKKHGIRFEQACEVFADRFFRLVDATVGDETRDAVLGMTENLSLLFVCTS